MTSTTTGRAPDRGPVLVLGAAGGQGGAVAAALLSAGRPVRALVRDPASPKGRQLSAAGAQLAAGDFTDHDALVAGMRAVSAVFALTTPFEAGADAELLQGRTIIAAAAAARVPHLVFSSVAGATADTGIPHFDSKAAIERALAASDVPHTVVAPTYFYDNALGGYRDLLDGVFELPLPAGHPLQQLDRPDLGAFVEIVLRDPRTYAGRRIELASDAPTPAQMSAALADALGRHVRYAEVPMSSVRRGSADMAAMWEFLCGAGYQADIAALRRDYPTVGWTSFASWADRVLGPTAAVTDTTIA
jgi:uncharacterized protein YbjT (DUF2867 family)